ncbi:MAG: IS1595 family transposase [Rhodopseudomonas sp.]|uniref:IS1595 family transposase n=1 Tax=Rhodopseudomonas sp. TaxID=1078 RepID=UPI0017CDF15E|nr:IS1595 family transposase [Rhodopseudomonas sp.]NVN88613.1 IS1595 family transposase [Rhodopseudomonas sp.]
MSRRPKPVPQMTVAQFESAFPDEEACKVYLQARRWPEGVKCPRCHNDKVFPVKSMPFKWQCYKCTPNQGYRFSVIAGTIFENTNKPLRDWFRVVHLMLASKKGMSALQIQRMMGFGSYGTAHSMCHKIRAALVEPEAKLGGIVEVDETWIGGKDANRHWDKKHHGQTGGAATGKTPVIGAVTRKGNVIARALSRVTKDAAERFVREMVSDKVSLLATDENHVYSGLTEYNRKTVEHQRKQYVVGAVHTNTIEGFWSIFKRGIVGSFHKVSEKYLPLYVAEFQFRYNNRQNPDVFGSAIAGC